MTSTGDCVGNNFDGENTCGEMGYETYSQEQTLYQATGQWASKAMQGKWLELSSVGDLSLKRRNQPVRFEL